jgi:hypothetical protein
MRGLVALAEQREAACKEQISDLLASRSTMYEAAPARQQAASPVLAAQGSADEDVAAEQSQDDGFDETVEAAAAKIEEAEKRMEAAQVGVSTGLQLQALDVAGKP